MASARFVPGVIAIALALTVPGLGRAQTCATDADCAKGLRCQTDVITTTPAVACIADSDGVRTCTTVPAPPPPTVTMSCQPAPCASKSDCGPAMTCYSHTETECSGGAPVAKCERTDTDCPVPEPESCTDKTSSACVYPWLLPCNTDADCGTDFICRPSEIGMCTGSAPSAGSGSDSAGTGGASGSSTAAPAPGTPVPAPIDGGVATTPTCTIITSFPGYCQANVIACASDADCPLAWTCASANGVAVATAPAPVDSGAVGGGPALDPNPVVTTAPTKACQPPSMGGRGGATLGGDEGSYQPPTVNVSLPDAGVTTTKGTPGTASMPDAGAATTASTPPTPSTSQGTKTTESTPVAARTSGGGCSVAAGEGAESSAWLVLAALGLLVARRRRD